MNISQYNNANEKSNLCSNYDHQDYNSNNKPTFGVANNTVSIDVDNICPICLDDFKNEDEIAKTECYHMYHYKCLKQMLSYRKICAICNGDVYKYCYYKSKQNLPNSNHKIVNVQHYTIHNETLNCIKAVFGCCLFLLFCGFLVSIMLVAILYTPMEKQTNATNTNN